MNVHISYKAAKATDVEREFAAQIEKLSRRLQVYKPDLVHLHAIVDHSADHNGSRGGHIDVSLNLRLPSGQMASQESAPNAVTAVKAAFGDVIAQLTKHKDLLRQQHNWRRRDTGDERRERIPETPLEQTVAGVHPPAISVDDIHTWVNANLEKLDKFVGRELRHRENAGLIRKNLIAREEVIDEVIASALGDDQERPGPVALEPWLYSLAIQAIGRLTLSYNDGAEGNGIPLEQSARKQNVTGSDEAVLQFHQPDETLHREDVIADQRIGTPEQNAASDENIDQIERALHGASREDREAFVLFAIEGFSVPEIAQISRRDERKVFDSINAARDLIERKLPVGNELKTRLMRYSNIA